MPSIVWPDNLNAILLIAVDVLAVTVLLYNFILVLRGRRAMHVLSGLSVLLLLYGASVWLGLRLLRAILEGFAPFSPVAFIVLFQSELRGYLTRLGRIRWFRANWLNLSGRLGRREIVDEIVLAAEYMSERKIGALIVLERDIGLRTFIESGVTMDAVVTRDLLLAIFYPGAQLHDGAVILQGDRIAAAACFLPLHVSSGSTLSRGFHKLGTRHRAAIGVTEETDALAVVISEETGHVSIGWRGELEADITLDRLRERLTYHANGTRPGDTGMAELEKARP